MFFTAHINVTAVQELTLKEKIMVWQ